MNRGCLVTWCMSALGGLVPRAWLLFQRARKEGCTICGCSVIMSGKKDIKQGLAKDLGCILPSELVGFTLEERERSNITRSSQLAIVNRSVFEFKR